MLKAIQIIAITLSGALLVGTFALIFAESRWVDPNPSSPRDYFLHGSTGTELMPLAVFQVLPTLFPEQFQPAGNNAGDWIDQYGWLRPRPLGINAESLRAERGFITEPLEAAFTRAPYPHKGSVPTLAELINLKPRRAVFYRGRSSSIRAMWVVVTDQPDLDHYFRYGDSFERGRGLLFVRLWQVYGCRRTTERN
jgi:hypothetical protein